MHERLAGEDVLTVKLGFDPAAPDLHLGHTVVLNKMKMLQDLVTVLCLSLAISQQVLAHSVGITDSVDQEAIDAHAATYAAQIYKVLDPEKTELVYNSAWLDKLSARDIINLAAGQSVARMLERDDFKTIQECGHQYPEFHR